MVKNTIFMKKTFVDCLLVQHQRIPRSKILQRKLSQIATKLRNSQTFSPSKVTRHTVSQVLQTFGHLPLRIMSDPICTSEQCCSSERASAVMLRSTLRWQRQISKFSVRSILENVWSILIMWGHWVRTTSGCYQEHWFNIGLSLRVSRIGECFCCYGNDNFRKGA